MKKNIFILLIVAVVMIFAACGNVKVLEIEDLQGNTIEVSTQGLSDEQIEALTDVASGDSDLKALVRSNLFTQQELTKIGLTPVGNMSMPAQGGRMNNDDFSDVDIDSLNLEGLTEEQVSAVEDIIAGDLSPQGAVDDGVLTMQELQQTGLLTDMPQGGQRKSAE
jgi:hypothetical protein